MGAVRGTAAFGGVKMTGVRGTAKIASSVAAATSSQ